MRLRIANIIIALGNFNFDSMLLQTILLDDQGNEPLGLEWIDDLVEMRDVKEVSLELDGEEGQAEMLLERLIEVWSGSH